MTLDLHETRRAPETPRAIAPFLIFALLVLVIVAVLLSALPAMAQDGPREINRIILRVNNQIMTYHDYQRRKTRQIDRILGDSSIDPERRQEMLAGLGKLLVRNAFEEMLLRSRASQLSIIVDDVEIDRAVDRIRQEQGIANDEEFRQALAASGMNLEELREVMRRDLIAQRLMGREMQDRITLEEDDLRAYYRNHPEEFRVPEQRWLEEVIVLDSSGLDESQRRGVAEEIRAAVEGGVPFAEAVAPYQDQGITSGVVDLGWLKADELGGALRDSAFTLEPGGYSPPIEGRGGLHIMHLREVREATLRPFTEVQEEIYRQEQARRFQKETNAYMAELAERAYVRENLPPEAVGYRDLVTFEQDDERELFQGPLASPEPAEEEGS